MSVRTDSDQPIRFFLPGPIYVLDEVRQAQSRQPIGHRSAEFNRLYGNCVDRLRPIFRTEGEVVAMTGSATLIMESAVLSTVEERVLNLVCGAFSERWHTISKAVGKETDRIEVPWGEAIDPELVRQALRRGHYEAVTTVHSETSTGVLNPLADIARVVREESDALVLVDAVSSLAGAAVETDEWGLDIVLTGGQKALAVPPGLAFAAISDRAEAKFENVGERGYYTDLGRVLEKSRSDGTVTTGPICTFYALDRQLDHILDEGIEARWERHERLQAETQNWAGVHGFGYVAAESYRSPTVSALRPPEEIEAPVLVERLADAGYTVGTGYGKLEPESFRIGHMGEVRESDLHGLLSAIEDVLE